MIFFSFVFLGFSAIEPDECEGQNTIKTANGTCQCLPSFPFGDPNSKEGCYKCVDQCHEKAICAPPGRCKCIPGLIGDGKSKCDIPTPQILDVSPKQISKESKELINVAFTSETNYTAIKGFCKFGNQIKEAVTITQNNVMKCLPPKSTLSAEKLSISFDNVSFSEDQIFIEFLDTAGKPPIQLVWQVWAVVLLIIIIIVIYTNIQKPAESKDKFSPEERVGFKSQPKNPMNGLVDQGDDYQE